MHGLKLSYQRAFIIGENFLWRPVWVYKSLEWFEAKLVVNESTRLHSALTDRKLANNLYSDVAAQLQLSCSYLFMSQHPNWSLIVIFVDVYLPNLYKDGIILNIDWFVRSLPNTLQCMQCRA